MRRANGQLVLFPTLDEVYDYLAEEMVKEFEKAAAGDRIVSFIMPVGPTQPYRLMAEKINYRQLSLRNVRFFFMDEYVDDEKDELIPDTHPLSFRGQIGPLFFDRVRPDLLMPKDQIVETTAFLWANTILRISALGAPGDDYPVTHARHHASLRIVSDYGTARKPRFNI